MTVGIGDIVGQYRLLELLGQGGMAVVYRAYQASLEREVAVKILTPGRGGPEFVERFRREARSVSRLRHPNIVAVFDFGEQGDLVYMVSELVPGGTLAQRLGRPLPLDWIAVRLAAISSALDYAHASGLVHRDVKPSNVLLTADEIPVLSDFGVAKLLQEDSASLTAVGMVVGTPEYMSPEQALGQEVGPASDVYSLGVVLHEMLVGRPPFSAPTPIAVAMMHVNNTLPAPRSVNPALPASVEAVLVRCLAKEPGRRYQRAGDLARAYAEAVGIDPRELAELAPITPSAIPRISTTGSGGTVTGPPTAQFSTGRAIRARTARSGELAPAPKRRTALVVAVAVLGLVLVAAALLWLSLPSLVANISPTPLPAPTGPEAGPPPKPVPATTAPAPTAAVVVSPPPSSPIVRLAPTESPVPRWILAPANGASVAEKLVVRGALVGPSGPGRHYWLMVRPRQGADNWWAADREITPGSDGAWQTTVYLGGEQGSFHRLAFGFADTAGNEVIVRHLAEHPGQPFERGLPAGFTSLDEVTVEKRGD